jgi:histidinol-phosphatase
MEAALAAVKTAEEIILKYFNSGVQTELKDDLSPVTVADRQAEEAIKQVISSTFPGNSFYGEEGEKTDLSNHRGFTWIIDPIDGTKSYIRGTPLFATELALMHDGELVLGVSNAPMLTELMYAERGKGCYLNGKRVKVSEVDKVEDSYLSFGNLNYFAKHGNAAALLKLAQDVRWSRGIGDLWSYHLLAQGKLDIVIEAQTKLWDIAALTVIVEEAGGRFTQLDGNLVGAKAKSALASNGWIHDEVLGYFLETR